MGIYTSIQKRLIEAKIAEYPRKRNAVTLNKFHYEGGYDPDPLIIVLGQWTWPYTGKTYTQGINVHYLSSEQLAAIVKLWPKVVQVSGGKNRYRYIRKALESLGMPFITKGGPAVKKSHGEIRRNEHGIARNMSKYKASNPHGVYRTYDQEKMGDVSIEYLYYDKDGNIVKGPSDTNIKPPAKVMTPKSPAPVPQDAVPSTAPTAPAVPPAAQKPPTPAPTPPKPPVAPAAPPPTAAQPSVPKSTKVDEKPEVKSGHVPIGVKTTKVPPKAVKPDDTIIPQTSVQQKRSKIKGDMLKGIDIGKVKDEDAHE